MEEGDGGGEREREEYNTNKGHYKKELAVVLQS
jgi:hypothetical protein